MARRLALALLLALAACHRPPADPQVTAAWVRLPAVPGRPAAAYFTIHGGQRDDRLIKIASALAADTSMHDEANGAMVPLAEVPVPAGGLVRFQPGKRHAMLMGLDPVITPGTAVPLRFGFASGRTAEAEAKTVAAGGDAPF